MLPDMRQNFYPLLFEPVYMDYVWGGTRIPETYHRTVKQPVCAESWEITDRPEGMSRVLHGPLRGKTLHDLVASMGSALVGTATGTDKFPLLIKIIDARERLSVQVHPDQESALRTGGEPKTEMWFVLDADPGARVFAGLRTDVGREAFEKALEQGRLEEILQPIPVRKGDAVFVPGGRIHAIDAGCLLLEVQQNSNTTYRVYDWGRLGQDGKPRPLHLEEALQTIRWNDTQAQALRPARQIGSGENTVLPVVECPYFQVSRIDIQAPLKMCPEGKSFHALFAFHGEVLIEGGDGKEKLSPGTSCLLPAALPHYTLTPLAKTASLILITRA